jgi:hypothetical protein
MVADLAADFNHVATELTTAKSTVKENIRRANIRRANKRVREGATRQNNLQNAQEFKNDVRASTGSAPPHPSLPDGFRLYEGDASGQHNLQNFRGVLHTSENIRGRGNTPAGGKAAPAGGEADEQGE